MINRKIDIGVNLEKGKVLIIYGARQVGKTTLVNEFLSTTKLKYKFFTGDQIDFADDFSKCDPELIQKMFGGLDLLVIDEAQKINNIGRALKITVDFMPGLYVIATGSSSFDLANATDEPLTGRKNLLTLYPIAVKELLEDHNQYDIEKKIPEYLIYGMYPNIITYKTFEQKRNRITEIKDVYLIKDILEFHKVKKSQTVINLLKLLAFQTGGEVSTSELGGNLGLDHKTVMRYLELLEKSFVIFRLNGFSRNSRKEINKMGKYYFYDLGIRNALISNFNDLDTRNDVGQLWENFMISERVKRNAYSGVPVNYYFWRTYAQKEIDWVEERGGRLYGYEFKWKNARIKMPEAWHEMYKDAGYEVITKENGVNFIT